MERRIRVLIDALSCYLPGDTEANKKRLNQDCRRLNQDSKQRLLNLQLYLYNSLLGRYNNAST
jgi:hypothetical protein